MTAEIVVSTTESTTSEYGVWDIWETTEPELAPELDTEEERAEWARRRDKRRRQMERRRKQEMKRRRQEQIYEKDYFSNSQSVGEMGPSLLNMCEIYLILLKMNLISGSSLIILVLSSILSFLLVV